MKKKEMEKEAKEALKREREAKKLSNDSGNNLHPVSKNQIHPLNKE